MNPWNTPRLLRASLAVAIFILSACHTAAAPTPIDPGVVRFDGALGHELISAQAGGEVLARLTLHTGDVETTARPPLNIALVLDTSGSMMGEPIERVREATNDILSMLRGSDRISIVAFHSVGEVVLESTPIEDLDMVAISARIGAIEAQGTTAMKSGLELALQEVQRHRTEETLDWMVLLGDGVPNEPNSIPALATFAGNNHIPIAALGLGLAYDEALMGQIAQLSGGHFDYIEAADAVAGVFRDEVLRLERVLARNAMLQLQPGPGVEILEVVGQNTPGGGGPLQLHLGDIAEGESRHIVVRMTAPARRSGSLVELLDATLHFEDAYTEAGLLERRLFFGARSSESDDAVAASRNEAVHQTAATLQAAATTLQAIQMVRMGHVNEASAMLDGVHGEHTSYDSLRGSLPGTDEVTPAAAPASMERSIRRAHSEALEVLGY